MKKRFRVFALALTLCVLSGCGLPQMPADGMKDTAEETSAAVLLTPVPDEAAVRNAFEKAMEVYGWFDLCTLDMDSADSIERGGRTYYRVISEEVPSYDALRTLVFDLFDTTTGERLLSEDSDTPTYIDHGGVLYGQDGARGSDVTKGDYTLTVEPENSRSILCRVRVETVEYDDSLDDYRKVTGYEDYTYHYQLVGTRWVFTDFDLFY